MIRREQTRRTARERSEAEGYFARLEERFEEAEAAAGPVSPTVLGVAGTTVELRLAGRALEPVLLPALRHLAVPAPRPDGLTVLAFDSASTGVDPPPPPAPAAAADPEVARILQRGAGLFSMLDRRRSVALLWTRDAARVPWNEVAAPLRMILQPWLAPRGWQLVHAGAVGTHRGGVLLVGRSGAGKSTTALACLAAGLGYAGDDYVLAAASPAPEVQGLYASAKLREDRLDAFPELARRVVNPRRGADEKPVLFLDDGLRAHLVRRMPLRAVVVPRVTGTAEPALRPISAAAALAAAAPSTLFQIPLDRSGALRRLRRLVEACPCWELEAGPDLAGIAAAIGSLLAEAG